MHTADATKTITKAVPTVDLDGNVTKWDIEIIYEFNGYSSTFLRDLDIAPTKTPADFTKAELWEIANQTLLDSVFESQYESVVLAPAPTEQKIDGFDVDSLA